MPRTIKDHFLTQETFYLKEAYPGILKTEPAPQDINRYYQSENYISHNDRRKGLQDRLYYGVKNRMNDVKLRLIKKHRPSAKSLLDVGAGTGAFILNAKQKGWKVSGIECHPQAAQVAKQKNLEIFSSYPNAVYDVVTMWHVLEHVPDIAREIACIRKCLAEDGLLVVAVPNYNSADAKYYGEYWAAYDVPRHIWHFSKRGLCDFMAKNQLEYLGERPLFFDAFYVSLLSERYKNGKPSFLKGIINGCRSNLLALKTKEYSSNIFIFKKQAPDSREFV